MKELIALSFLLFLFSSCGPEPLNLDLSRDDRKVVDSLYKEQISDLGPSLDSMCNAYKKERYQQMKDSLIELRLEEIESLLPNE